MTRYESIKDFAQAEKLPLVICKEAKKYVPECFNHARVVDAETLRKYVDEHYDDLEEEASETLEALKKERMRKQITRADYEFEIVKHKYIDKETTIQRITDIATAQKVLLKTALTEQLPARLVGLSQAEITIELENVFNAICKEMQQIKL